MQKHKHSELIKAWADGAEIQFYCLNGWEDAPVPDWFNQTEYRIKPEKPKPVVKYMNVYEGDYQCCYIYNSLETARESQSSAITYRLKIVTYPDGKREFSVVE